MDAAPAAPVRVAPGAGPEGSGTRLAPTIAALLETDSLTGLYNRAYFEARLRQELAGASAEQPLALFLLDLDRFKAINDRFGHTVGDRALQEVARALRAACPPRGVVCRLAGDEFTLLIPRVTAVEARWFAALMAHEIARRLLPVAEGTPPLRLEASIGLAMAPAEGTDVAALLARADAAMYAAKRRAAGQRSGLVPATRGPAPLVGREELLARAEALLAQVQSGFGRCVLLDGPAGIGKTRLAQEVADRARRRGCVVVVSALGAARSGQPLAAVRGFAQALVRANRRSHINHRPFRDEQLTSGQIAVDLARLLHIAAAGRGIVWFLDDLPQADASTRAVVTELAARVADLPLLLLGTARLPGHAAEEPGLALWRDLAGPSGGEAWPVPPLDAAAARNLAGWALGKVVPAEVADCVPAGAGGNPLLILRLAAAASQEAGAGVQPAEGGDWLAAGLALDLNRLYVSQLASLPAPALAVLAAAATLGYEVDTATLAAVAPATPATLAQALDTLVAGGWLERAGQHLRFSHPLAQETVYQHTPAAFRRGLHRLAGQVLAMVPDHPRADLARHGEAGGEWASATALHWQAAAAAESAHALGAAAHHYRRSLEWAETCGRMPADAAELGIRTAELFRLTEDITSAQEVLHFTLPRCATALEQGKALLALALSHWDMRQSTDAYAAAVLQAWQVLSPLGPSPDLAEAAMLKCVVESRHGQREAARRSAELGLELAHLVQDSDAELRLNALIGAAVTEMGDFALAAECLRRVESLLRAPGRRGSPRLPRALFNCAVLAWRLGKFRRAIALARRTERCAQRSGDQNAVVAAALNLADFLAYVGDVQECRSVLTRCEGQVRNGHIKYRHFWWLEISTMACLHAGEVPEARSYATLAQELARSLGHLYQMHAASLLAELQMASGARPDPARWAPAALLPLSRAGYAADTALTAARIHLLAGDLPAAQTLVDAARGLVITRGKAAKVHWVQAMIYEAEGRVRAALTTYRRAARHGGSAYTRALSCRQVATLLLSSHDQRKPQPARWRQAAAYLRTAQRLLARIGNEGELQRLAPLVEQCQGGEAAAVDTWVHDQGMSPSTGPPVRRSARDRRVARTSRNPS